MLYELYDQMTYNTLAAVLKTETKGFPKCLSVFTCVTAETMFIKNMEINNNEYAMKHHQQRN